MVHFLDGDQTLLARERKPPADWSRAPMISVLYSYTQHCGLCHDLFYVMSPSKSLSEMCSTIKTRDLFRQCTRGHRLDKVCMEGRAIIVSERGRNRQRGQNCSQLRVSTVKWLPLYSGPKQRGA